MKKKNFLFEFISLIPDTTYRLTINNLIININPMLKKELSSTLNKVLKKLVSLKTSV